jgi:hypothetical protein
MCFAGLFESQPHGRDNCSKMFARREFRHHAAIPGVHGHLRRHHARKNRSSVFHYRRRGFVARGFDAED